MAKKAKKLPYFKFETSEWTDGNITDCSLAAQGLFINICALYWSRKGDLTHKTVKSKFKFRPSLFEELTNCDALMLKSDQIVIKFLEEQFEEREIMSYQNSKNAQIRWNQTNSDAVASQTQSEEISVASHLEENREEEKRIEESRVESSSKSIVTYEVLGQSNPVTLTANVPNKENDKAQFSDYERWTTDVISGNDQMFEQMLMKEPFKLNGALAEYAKSYLKLLAEYPKKSPPDQHRFRIALIGHISENVNKNYNGQRNTTKGGIGQTNPEPGKDYRTAGGF
jgi:hypothetical protein